jgi:hypothetical protein
MTAPLAIQALLQGTSDLVCRHCKATNAGRCTRTAPDRCDRTITPARVDAAESWALSQLSSAGLGFGASAGIGAPKGSH